MTQQLKNISLKTLLAEQNIDHREFFICIKAIFNEIPDLFKERAETMNIMINQNISKACDELLLSSEVRRIAFKISEKFEGRLGFKSRVIAASSVSIAIKILSLERSASILQISECLEITASTVYSHVKNVEINVLKEKYREYLNNLNNPIHIVIPDETIQEKIKKLNAEVLIEEQNPLIPIKIQVPILVNNNQITKKLKKRRSSEFITKNKEIFSKFIQNSICFDSFGIQFKESKFVEVSRSLELPNEPDIFTEFEFSPPIS
jgi:predicted transcriptional regulator